MQKGSRGSSRLYHNAKFEGVKAINSNFLRDILT